MNEKKVVNRNFTIALGIICILLLVGLIVAIMNFTTMILDKDNTISNLNAQVQILQNQRKQLQAWLEGNQTILKTTMQEMHQMQVWLNSNQTLLMTTRQERDEMQKWLEGNITYYTTQINSISQQISTLNAQIANLQAEYDGYMKAYQQLQSVINNRWNEQNLETFVTPEDPTVSALVLTITGGWANHQDWNEYWKDIKAMYNWIIDKIEYRSDGLFPKLPDNPSNNVSYYDEMWQFPNETLELNKGDCEDMAILLCSMIRCYTGTQLEAECIGISSMTSGHLAVQILTIDHKLVIFDPAGRYYSHDHRDNIAFNNISMEIENWLNYWKHEMGEDVHVDLVFSDKIHKRFNSTQEYLTWMYSR